MLQLEPDVLPKENELLPFNLEAKLEIFLVIFLLLQVGQDTSPILFTLKTSVSNDIPQSVQTNSKMGIINSKDKMNYVLLVTQLIEETHIMMRVM